MIRVDIIGGSGFIGLWLLSKLIDDSLSVRVIDLVPPSVNSDLMKFLKIESHQFQYVCADLTDERALEKSLRQNSIVVHLAAAHSDSESVENYYKNNVKGSLILKRCMERKGVSGLIFTSSVAVYGSIAGDDHEIARIGNAVNHYGRSKAIAEDVFDAWHNEKPRSRCLEIIRPTAIFGPGGRGNINRLIRYCSSQVCVLPNCEGVTKSVGYVDNLAEQLVRSIECVRSASVGYVKKSNHVAPDSPPLLDLISFMQEDSIGIKVVLPKIFSKLLMWLNRVLGKNILFNRIVKFTSHTVYPSNHLNEVEYSRKDIKIKKAIKITQQFYRGEF